MSHLSPISSQSNSRLTAHGRRLQPDLSTNA